VPFADDALREAIEEGVESLILRADTPRAARKELSLLLNRAHTARWHVREDTGEVTVLPAAAEEKPSQFEAISKTLDADELGALLRIKLRVDERVADGGYAAALGAPPVAPSKL
jgi:hypothetical protein